MLSSTVSVGTGPAHALPFGMAGDAGEPGIHDQSRAVLHQPMADEAQLRLHPRPLAVEHGVGIGGAPVRLVRALLSFEVCPCIAPAAGTLPSSPGSLGLKLFSEAQASISVPSTEKCSLDRSLFTRGWASKADRSCAAIAPSRSRSRFFEKTE